LPRYEGEETVGVLGEGDGASARDKGDWRKRRLSISGTGGEEKILFLFSL